MNKGWLLIVGGLIVGASGGVFVTWQLSQEPREPRHEVRYSQTPFYDSAPEQMLYPDGTTLEALYPDDGFRAAIRNPDSILIHPLGGDGTIRRGEHHFSSIAAMPDPESSARLVRALCSLSSYEPPGKMCVFRPMILLRLEKEGKSYELMFCFGCRQIQASAAGGADMSAQGSEVFLKCFCDSLPDFKELHEFRRKSALRQNGVPVREIP